MENRKDVTEDYENIEITPFTLAGESNEPTQAYSKHEKFSVTKSKLKIATLALVIIVVVSLISLFVLNTSVQRSIKEDAFSSVDNFNNSVESLNTVMSNNTELQKEVADFANQQKNPDDKQNANNLSNAIRASVANGFTPIQVGQTNEQAANNIAIYYALCDLADSKSLKPLQQPQTVMLKDACSTMTKNAYSMMNKVPIWNASKEKWYGKISLVNGGELPDVTKL